MALLADDVFRVLKSAEKGGAFMSTPEIYRELCKSNPHPPVIKTVHRALLKLLDDRVVESQKRGTTHFWRRCAGAAGFTASSAGLMTHDQALALQTLRRFSSRQIPSLVAESLSSLFDMAANRLDAAHTDSERRFKKWTEKVEVEGGAFSLHHPVIDNTIFSNVSRALFSEQRLSIVYRVRSKADLVTTKVVDPLGLVEVGGFVYLVASTPKHALPAMYRLDRMATAAVLPQVFEYPADFALSEYVKQQRQFDFMVEGVVQLELRFINGVGDHLIESPLSDDQVAARSGRALNVKGTVLLSQRLRWWLRSFGPNVEVVRPSALRVELAREARTLARMYEGVE